MRQSDKNATTSPAKFLLAKRLLKDRALQAFKNAALTAGAETTQNYKVMIKAVTAHIMPKKALQKQKHHMPRFLKKPLDMKVKKLWNEW